MHWHHGKCLCSLPFSHHQCHQRRRLPRHRDLSGKSERIWSAYSECGCGIESEMTYLPIMMTWPSLAVLYAMVLTCLPAEPMLTCLPDLPCPDLSSSCVAVAWPVVLSCLVGVYTCHDLFDHHHRHAPDSLPHPHLLPALHTHSRTPLRTGWFNGTAVCAKARITTPADIGRYGSAQMLGWQHRARPRWWRWQCQRIERGNWNWWQVPQ